MLNSLPCPLLVSSSEMSRIDMLAIKEKNITASQLMFDAASALFERLLNVSDRSDSVLILCGGGNNGGDGYVLAQLFARSGRRVHICNLAKNITSESTHQYRQFALAYPSVEEVHVNDLLNISTGVDIIIDAVFGTGFHGELSDEVATAFNTISKSHALKVAVDIPSGVYCDSGQVAQNAFIADLTITFEFLKPCLVSYPAKKHCGNLSVVSIGFSSELRDCVVADGYLLDENILQVAPKICSIESHKGDFGRMLSVCGCGIMTGAVLLASAAALRSGIGLLYLACERSIMAVLQSRLTEPIFIPYDEGIDNFSQNVGDLSRFDVILHGCGSGRKRPDITEYLIENYDKTLVLDADALNNVSANPEMLKKHNLKLIITPHPLEAARLCDCTVNHVQQNRIETAKELAKKYNAVTVLKGVATVVADPSGRYAVNTTGNPGMAKGGSGDVLAGMIAAYRMEYDDIFVSTCAAVYDHGLIGDRCAAKMSRRAMLPSDMVEELKTYINI